MATQNIRVQRNVRVELTVQTLFAICVLSAQSSHVGSNLLCFWDSDLHSCRYRSGRTSLIIGIHHQYVECIGTWGIAK